MMKIPNFTFCILPIALLVIAGCSAKKPTGTSSSSNTSAPATSDPALTCSTSVLDYGQKGTAAAVARGTYSDVQMIPSTSQPATAFADAGSLAMKLSYWNGSQFITEIISGEGSGAFVRLAFLSSGIPLIFWTQGTSVKMAIRSAALTAPGTWTAGIIDTGTAPRALEVSVNPLNQVGVVYISDTATAGRVKFLYCDAPCAGPSSFQSMSSTPYIENTNVIAAMTTTGISWCKASDTSYYPAVSYAVTGSTKFAICRNSIASCLTNTNWNIQSVVASGLTGSKVLIDPNITGDIPKVIALGASGPVPYLMGSTACTSAPTAFTGGTAIGTSTTGNQWMKILKDANGKFHLIANEATTSLRYYNSQTTTFNGTWNTQKTVETITFAAAHGGGAAIDNLTQSLYMSYGIGAAPFDLRLGRVTDYTVASSGASTITKYTPDTSGGLQLTAANSQLSLISMDITSTDIPAIAYADYSVGTAASGKLKFGIRSSTENTSSWTYGLIPGTLTPEFPVLKFDHNDNPWIGYFDAGNNRFYLVTNSETDGSGTWAQYEFPATPTGAPAALPMANQIGLGFVTVSGVARPLMVIADNAATGRGIKASVFNPLTLAWSAVTTLDSIASGASHLSMDSNSENEIILGYRDLLTNKAKISTTTDGSTWTTPITISGVGQGAGLMVKINPVTFTPIMTYFDRAGNAVIEASCAGSVATCATGGWSSRIVDSAAGVSGLVTGNEQLLATALHFDSTGNQKVFYPTGQGSYGSLKSGTWNTTSLTYDLTTVSNGINGTLSGLAALNFGISGWGISSVTSSSGQYTTTYLGPGNWLYTTSCGQ